MKTINMKFKVIFLLLAAFFLLIPYRDVFSIERNFDNFKASEEGFVDSPYLMETIINPSEGVLYKFWIHDKSLDVWKQLNDYNERPNITWIPEKPGLYRVVVHTKDTYSVKEYDDYHYKDISVTLPQAQISEFNANKKGFSDSPYSISADGNGINGVQYKYWIHDKSNDLWIQLNEYSETSSITWVPEKPGDYRVVLHVKDVMSKNEYDNYQYKDITVINPRAQIRELKADIEGFSNTPYKISGIGVGVNGVQYKFWIHDKSADVWTELNEYSDTPDITWTPDKPGEYRVVLHVKDTASKNEYDDYQFKDINVSRPQAHLSELNTDMEGFSNTPYKISGIGVGVNEVHYKFWIHDKTTDIWTSLNEYSETPYISWIPEKSGEYRVVLHVKDVMSKEEYDDYQYQDINISIPQAHLSEFKAIGDGFSNSAYKILADGRSVNGIEYKFWIHDKSADVWTNLNEYSDTPNITWTPRKSGEYRIVVHVRDHKSRKEYDDYRFIDIDAIASSSIITDFSVISGEQLGSRYEINTNAVGSSIALYKYWIHDLTTNQWTIIKDYSSTQKINWKPTKIGDYRIVVHVKDSYSEREFDDYKYIDVKVTNSLNIETIPISIEDALKTQLTKNNQIYITNKSVPAYIQNKAIVLANGFYVYPTVNIRREPKLSSEVYLNTQEMTRIIVSQKITGDIFNGNSDWYLIEYNDENLYVHTSFVKHYSYEHIVLNDTFIRANMSDNSHIYGVIKAGGTVSLLEQIDNIWSEVNYGPWRNPTPDDLKNKMDTSQWVHEESITPELFQFLNLNSTINISVDKINKYLEGRGILQGMAESFIRASRDSNVNLAYLIAHTRVETGNGTSDLGKGIVVNGQKVYNFFGIRAYDGTANSSGSQYAYTQKWFTPEAALLGGAEWISENYINHNTYEQNSLYKMRWNPYDINRRHQYATDVDWSLKIAKLTFGLFLLSDDFEISFEIPVH